MATHEQAVVFECSGESLVGVVCSSDEPSETGVVIVVGGPQYRAGSHRYFVELARALAASGHATLRFDYRGMGDSSGTPRTFEEVDVDIRAAIDALFATASRTRQVVLWGLCDGASAALLYARARTDARVSGLCLLNPWIRSESSLARTHVKHYYLQRLAQPQFWRKLFSGKVALEAVSGMMRSVVAARVGRTAPESFQARMAAGLRGFGGPVLLLLSENDYTAKEFVEYARHSESWLLAFKESRLVQHALTAADHTLSDSASRARAEELVLRWLREEFRAGC